MDDNSDVVSADNGNGCWTTVNECIVVSEPQQTERLFYAHHTQTHVRFSLFALFPNPCFPLLIHSSSSSNSSSPPTLFAVVAVVLNFLFLSS